MTTDPLAWAWAQIAEDERSASAAQNNPLLNLFIPPRQGGKRSAAAHINTWRPDRVQVECEARRRLVGRHEPIVIHERGGAVACRCC